MMCINTHRQYYLFLKNEQSQNEHDRSKFGEILKGCFAISQILAAFYQYSN